MLALRSALLGVATFGLSACGDPFPEDFTITVDRNAALGFYKPAEFSESEIKGALARLCVGAAVSNYTEEVGPDGTTFFGANCSSGFQNGANGPVSIYVTRDPSGGLTFQQG